MDLILQFGSFPELSHAELSARYPETTAGQLVAGCFFVCKLNENPNFLLNSLGGTVKVLENLGQYPTDTATLAQIILQHTDNKTKNKLIFGLSFVDKRADYKLGIDIKRLLQQKTGSPVRFVQGKGAELTSVQVKTQGLLPPEGAELVLLPNGLLGRTLAVQDFADYSHRDYDRPGRNARRGMLPPKVAKMMINIGLTNRNPQESRLYDPFCGSGTVLTEAALLGINHILGSDIDDNAVSDSSDAMDWLSQQYDIQPETTIFRHDARKPLGNIKPRSIDLAVFEPFLGRPLGQKDQHQEKELAQMANLYLDALKALHPCLKTGAKVVIALPFDPQNKRFLPINQLFSPQKYSLDELLPKKSAILYARTGQRVGRQIVRLTVK